MIWDNVGLLREWRKQRHIVGNGNYKVYMENILEELFEVLYEKQRIPAIVASIMANHYNYDKELDTNEILDAVSDIRVFSINETEMMGYCANECLYETIKEISSREQDPAQKELWNTVGYDGTKWKKFADQPKDTLYVANYGKCKIKSI